MAVRTYYVSKLGKDYKISPNFKLKEFQSKDNADKVLCSEELMAKLEELRAWIDGKVTIGINSGYRTPTHNKRIGGASGSLHTKGTAADIVVKKDGKRIPSKLICCLCADLGFGGVALISDYAVHVDVRTGSKYRGDERKGFGNNVKNGDFYSYFGIKASQVKALKAKSVVIEPAKPADKEEEEMTQEQFNKMMDVYLSERASKEAQNWSAEDRKWAEDLGLIKGTGEGMSYQSFMTREQMVAILSRFADVLTNSLKK